MFEISTHLSYRLVFTGMEPGLDLFAMCSITTSRAGAVFSINTCISIDSVQWLRLTNSYVQFSRSDYFKQTNKTKPDQLRIAFGMIVGYIV